VPRFVSAVFLLLGFLLAACEPTYPQVQTLPQPPTADAAVLGPGDRLEVRVLEDAAISGEYTVEDDGTVLFPYLGSVRAGGASARVLADELTRGLREGGIFVEPRITVQVREVRSRLVTVLGAVHKPGSYTFVEGMVVADAIAAAGGLLDTSNPNRTTVTRRVGGAETSEVVPLSRIISGRERDRPLQAGDMVFVPESPI
jgi:polysaccharide export outer membrane protein